MKIYIIIITNALLIISCGYKGNLYLPEPSTPAKTKKEQHQSIPSNSTDNLLIEKESTKTQTF